MAMHHPFTSTHPDDLNLLDSNPGAARANAYDMVRELKTAAEKESIFATLHFIAIVSF